MTGEHVVQFYASDHELAENVGGYLAGALQNEEVVALVATPAHRVLLEGKLVEAGVDLALARSAGVLVAHDADATLQSLLVDGLPDPGLFEAVVGNLVRAASASGRSVRVYGEMVGILWEAGQVNAALELEKLWNELARDLPFSLFCAYPRASVAAKGQTEAIRKVCRLHSGVVGIAARPPTRPGGRGALVVKRSFAREAGASGAARRFVSEALRQCGVEELVDDAALVVAELASNALQHAYSAFTVVVSMHEDAVRITVRDASPLPPALRAAPEVATSGRGLAIVASLSTRWAAEPYRHGKVVWAELARPTRAATATAI